MSGLMRNRASRRSCTIHGDNGCEIRGEAGPVERAQDKREWQRDAADSWTLSRDLTATVRSWVDAANREPPTCDCTSPLSGCRCGRPVGVRGGLCSYCRTNCVRKP